VTAPQQLPPDGKLALVEPELGPATDGSDFHLGQLVANHPNGQVLAGDQVSICALGPGHQIRDPVDVPLAPELAEVAFGVLVGLTRPTLLL